MPLLVLTSAVTHSVAINFEVKLFSKNVVLNLSESLKTKRVIHWCYAFSRLSTGRNINIALTYKSYQNKPIVSSILILPKHSTKVNCQSVRAKTLAMLKARLTCAIKLVIERLVTLERTWL